MSRFYDRYVKRTEYNKVLKELNCLRIECARANDYARKALIARDNMEKASTMSLLLGFAVGVAACAAVYLVV